MVGCWPLMQFLIFVFHSSNKKSPSLVRTNNILCRQILILMAKNYHSWSVQDYNSFSHCIHVIFVSLDHGVAHCPHRWTGSNVFIWQKEKVTIRIFSYSCIWLKKVIYKCSYHGSTLHINSCRTVSWINKTNFFL